MEILNVLHSFACTINPVLGESLRPSPILFLIGFEMEGYWSTFKSGQVRVSGSYRVREAHPRREKK